MLWGQKHPVSKLKANRGRNLLALGDCTQKEAGMKAKKDERGPGFRRTCTPLQGHASVQ